VFVGEDPQLIGLGHGAFVLLTDDLADCPGRLQTRHPGQVDGRLSVTGATQHATVLCAQRHHMAGLGEVIGNTRWIRQQSHRGSAVRSRNTCSHTMSGVDSDGIGGAVLVLVDRIHRQQAQPVADIAIERNAQITRGVPDHESDQFGCGLLGGEDQIAFILAILIIDDNDGLTRSDVGNRPFDGVQSHHRCRLPVTRLTKNSVGMPGNTAGFSMNHQKWPVKTSARPGIARRTSRFGATLRCAYRARSQAQSYRRRARYL